MRFTATQVLLPALLRLTPRCLQALRQVPLAPLPRRILRLLVTSQTQQNRRAVHHRARL